MKKFAVIVAGGSGIRMQTEIPKQFLLLREIPVLMQTLYRFHETNLPIKLFVVLPEKHVTSWKALCARHNFILSHEMVTGGETRFDSVKNGINFIEENGLVAVHDAVRPLISPAFINRLFEDALKFGNAVPAIAVNETIRMVNGNENKTIDRSSLRIIQTPQVFEIASLKRAFDKPYHPSFTDEATVMEMAGEKIFLTEGEPANIKITNPKDLIFAEAFLKAKDSQ